MMNKVVEELVKEQIEEIDKQIEGLKTKRDELMEALMIDQLQPVKPSTKVEYPIMVKPKTKKRKPSKMILELLISWEEGKEFHIRKIHSHIPELSTGTISSTLQNLAKRGLVNKEKIKYGLAIFTLNKEKAKEYLGL